MSTLISRLAPRPRAAPRARPLSGAARRLAFALLSGVTHFSCVDPDAVARSTRWQGYTGMAPLVQPTVDRREQVGHLVRAFVNGTWGTQREAAETDAIIAAWAPLTSAQADGEWLAAAWRAEAGGTFHAPPRVIVHDDVRSFERAPVRLSLIHI